MGSVKSENHPARLQTRDYLPPVRAYGPEHLTEDQKYLQITLDRTAFFLEIRKVGTPQNCGYIAWLDTHPPDSGAHRDVDPRLPNASAWERARLIKMLNSAGDLRTDILITPESTKSIPSIKETVKIASELLQWPLALIILPGGKDRDEIARMSVIPPVAYKNVTSPQEDKFLGITGEGLKVIRELSLNGKGIMFIDDVYTTGGTLKAMQKVIHTALRLPEETLHPLVVVATESVYGDAYPQKPPDNVYPLIHLPEFITNIPNIVPHSESTGRS